MRSTLTSLAVVIVGLFATAAIAGGTAYADEPEDDETLFLTCPPFCEVPNPPLEFCFEPNPEDCQKEDDPVILELTCPPFCLDPEEEPAEEPEVEPADEPADEPAPQPTSGSQGGSNEPAAPASDNGSADATEEPEQDDSIVAPVNDFEEQASNTSGNSSNGALLAVLATGFGLLAGGGLAYTVMRRR